MVATMTCQANLLTNFQKAKSPASPTAPLQQPLGYSRPQTATFAQSGALNYGTDLIANTLRKANAKLEKVDPEETFSAFFGKKEKGQSGPVFRSALEQVSYETNSSLSQEAARAAKRQTVVDRVARIFGR